MHKEWRENSEGRSILFKHYLYHIIPWDPAPALTFDHTVPLPLMALEVVSMEWGHGLNAAFCEAQGQAPPRTYCGQQQSWLVGSHVPALKIKSVSKKLKAFWWKTHYHNYLLSVFGWYPQCAVYVQKNIQSLPPRVLNIRRQITYDCCGKCTVYISIH